MLISFFKKVLLTIILIGVAASAVAHTYFFGVSDISFNNESEHIEIIHQFTAHDIENTIAELMRVHFSPEHHNYDKYIQMYFEKHFTLKQNHKIVKLNWIGFEVKRGQLFAYQESDNKNYLANLVVKNTILVDTYAKQINIVNYQIAKLQGSLTFSSSLRVAKITNQQK